MKENHTSGVAMGEGIKEGKHSGTQIMKEVEKLILQLKINYLYIYQHISIGNSVHAHIYIYIKPLTGMYTYMYNPYTLYGLYTYVYSPFVCVYIYVDIK